MSRQELLDDPATAMPQARQFLGAYFHQDWPLERGGWEEVVDDFAEDSTRHDVRETASELRGLLDLGLSAEELARVLDRLGCSLDPAAYGLGASEWLALVEARLSARASG